MATNAIIRYDSFVKLFCKILVRVFLIANLVGGHRCAPPPTPGSGGALEIFDFSEGALLFFVEKRGFGILCTLTFVSIF